MLQTICSSFPKQIQFFPPTNRSFLGSSPKQGLFLLFSSPLHILTHLFSSHAIYISKFSYSHLIYILFLSLCFLCVKGMSLVNKAYRSTLIILMSQMCRTANEAQQDLQLNYIWRVDVHHDAGTEEEEDMNRKSLLGHSALEENVKEKGEETQANNEGIPMLTTEFDVTNEKLPFLKFSFIFLSSSLVFSSLYIWVFFLW